MTVQPGTTEPRVVPVRAPVAAPNRPSDAALSRLLAEVAGRLTGEGPRFCAAAPGRLDVMGGSAEYAGALVLNKPIALYACVAVQRRTDGKFCLLRPRVSGAAATDPPVIPIGSLNGSDPPTVRRKRADSLLGVSADDATRCVLGAVSALLHDVPGTLRDGGLSMAYSTALTSLSDVGAAAAVAAATIVAVAAAFGLTLEAAGAAELCRDVENELLGVPVGVGDAQCALSGLSDGLFHGRGEGSSSGGRVRLPAEISLLGIDTGAPQADALEKYAQVRAASFMGRTLIDRIVRHEGAGTFQWEGAVARVPVEAYVRRFRDRIPTKLKGRDYLKLFGPLDDPLTRVDPAALYKIRSRTEHHIYEHDRAVRFLDCMRRSADGAGDQALRDAGELMCASHWSYGQRCGLGSVETDLLVNLVRQYGREADVFGAKVSGRGRGGVVTVLMRATDRALEAVQAAMEAYAARTGRTPTLISGPADGALVTGARSF